MTQYAPEGHYNKRCDCDRCYCDECNRIRDEHARDPYKKLKEYHAPIVVKCDHPDFHANVTVNRLQDTGRFQADVKIQCAQCGIPMRFIGLPAGLDIDGAATSADATEARLSIAPKGDVVAATDGAPMGFSVRKPS